MKRFFLHPDLDTPALRRLFSDMDAVFAAKGERITTGPLSAVTRVRTAHRVFYVKCYRQAGRGFRCWVGRSRLQTELRSLALFNRWGLPAARTIAWGIEKKGPFFIRGFLATEEIADCDDLAQLVREQDARLANRVWVDTVARQIAEATRTMHQAGFAHGDLKWRNILVSRADRPQIYLIDCPAGAFWLKPFQPYRFNKDIACLDKVAKQVLSRTRRLRCFLYYLQQNRLTKKDKKAIRQILHFFDGRE